jgi:hypothetical protein
MGHSFIKFGKSTLRLRGGTFGVVCGIILVEFEKLPVGTPLKKVIEPVYNEIKEKEFFGGYDTVMELDGHFPTQAERSLASEFFNGVVVTISKFGREVPEAYVSTLPMGEWYRKMRWDVDEIIEPFKSLLAALQV